MLEYVCGKQEYILDNNIIINVVRNKVNEYMTVTVNKPL